MSHFTSVKTCMADAVYLKQALADLGHAWEDGPVEVRGLHGIRTAVEMRVMLKGSAFDIGFRKVGGLFECVADWEGLLGFDREKFLQNLTQRYAYHAARAKLEAQGFSLASEETAKDGQIHLVLRRMA
ncbi:MAG: DUF1257 domain-containing protein [Verrucomicrobiota bacterium]